MRKKPRKPEPDNDHFVSVQMYVKNGNGKERLVTKRIPKHLTEKTKLMQRHGVIMDSDRAFISPEKVTQDREDYRSWAATVEDTAVLEGLIKMENAEYKVEILQERIKEL